MPSTEFLLYLVSVTLIVVLLMNYMNQDNDKEDDKTRYMFEMLKRQDQDRINRLERERRNKRDEEDSASQESQQTVTMLDNQGQTVQCNNPQCMRTGRCGCKQRLNIRVNNLNNSNAGGPGFGPGFPPPDPLRRFDYDAVHDEFTPPFRRSYYDDYALHPGLYPTYTRGPPGRFRKVGTLIAQGVAHNDKYKFLNLNGREKYPGREYEYFVTSVDTESKIKFYIDTKGKEIRDGDSVTVKNLEGYSFIFSEDEDLSPKYDPYFVY